MVICLWWCLSLVGITSIANKGMFNQLFNTIISLDSKLLSILNMKAKGTVPIAFAVF
jgi:hypothetical protein